MNNAAQFGFGQLAPWLRPYEDTSNPWGGLPLQSAAWGNAGMPAGISPWQTQGMPQLQQQAPPQGEGANPYLPAGVSAQLQEFDPTQVGGGFIEEQAAPQQQAAQQGPQAMGIVPWQQIINQGQDQYDEGGNLWTPSPGFGVQGQNLVYDVAQPGNFGMQPNIGNQYYMPYSQENF